MKRKLLSMLLAVCMAASLLPTAALAAEGDVISVKIGSAAAVPYRSFETGWNAAVAAAVETPTDANAVLVTLLDNWTASGTAPATSFGAGVGFGGQGYLLVPSGKTITLDLNGKAIDRGLAAYETAVNGGNVFEIRGNLTLKDSGASGKITGAYKNEGSGAVEVCSYGTFTMEGGSITDNKASTATSTAAAGGVYTLGTFTMTGGSITGNTGSGVKSVGGVYVADVSNSTFTMTGGSITDNMSNVGAGGVFLESITNGCNNSFTVGGTAQVTGNKLTGGTASNVLLQNIDTGRTITCSDTTHLATGATIGVTTETTPTAGTPISITDDNSADYSEYFFSDAGYEKRNSGTGGAQKVQLLFGFNLPLGNRYYFDLTPAAGTITAGVSTTMGTINIGADGNWGYPALPDPTLHYVPFTYVGTVNAYSLTNGQASTAATVSDRRLFVADYNVSHTKTWTDLNAAELIFGKPFDTNYKLRCLSAGSSKIPDPLSGSPTTNEWDSILTKNSSWIKNWSNIYSWGQDTYSSNATERAFRGNSSARLWDFLGASDSRYGTSFGWRPALEVDTAKMTNSTDLKGVTLHLNGGTLKESEADISIICAGASFKAPSGTGLTRPSGNDSAYFKWNTQADGKGTSYEAGAPVQKSVTALYAQWNLPKEATPAAAFAATGADSGTLSGLTGAASYKYSVDGGSAYTDFIGATATITGGINAAHGVWVVKKGDTITTGDSNPQEIAVTQAATPIGIAKTDCTTAAQNDGTIIGVTSAMEYKKSSDPDYTPISDTKVTGLAPGTYKVRVKAKNAVLASADVGVTIGYNGGGGGGGGGDYTSPVKTEVESGKDVSATNLKALARGEKTLTVKGKNGEKLLLDADTVKALAKDGGKLNVSVADAKGKLTPAQSAQVGDRPVYDLSALLDGKDVTKFGGKVTVTLPYTLKDGERAEDVTVWFLAADGSLTELPAGYDANAGLVTFTLQHFSKYIVGIKAWVNPFSDVKAGDWCYDAVKFAHQNGLFSGVTATSFAPADPMTRAMLWTVLARQAKQDLSGGGLWYEKGMSWAIAEGISDGKNPEGNVTREQLVTMLWRRSGSPVLMDYPGLSGLSDVSEISAYARQAMAWAHQKGLVEGSDNRLMPQQNATRAQVAAIMARYLPYASPVL